MCNGTDGKRSFDSVYHPSALAWFSKNTERNAAKKATGSHSGGGGDLTGACDRANLPRLSAGEL